MLAAVEAAQDDRARGIVVEKAEDHLVANFRHHESAEAIRSVEGRQACPDAACACFQQGHRHQNPALAFRVGVELRHQADVQASDAGGPGRLRRTVRLVIVGMPVTRHAKLDLSGPVRVLDAVDDLAGNDIPIEMPPHACQRHQHAGLR